MSDTELKNEPRETILSTSSDTALVLLQHIIYQIPSANDLWYADKINKKELLKYYSVSNLDRLIKVLAQRNILIRVKRGVYSLNHSMF